MKAEQENLPSRFYEKYDGMNPWVEVAYDATPPTPVLVMRRSDMGLDVDLATTTGVPTNANLDNTGAPALVCFAGGTVGEEIAELVAATGGVSDTELLYLRTYLKTKYGL